MPVIAGARCAPPFPPLRGGQGGDCIVRASTITTRGAGAPPPCPPLRGGQGGRAQIVDERRKDPGLQPKAHSSSLTSLG